jgi:hypothetical protein
MLVTGEVVGPARGVDLGPARGDGGDGQRVGVLSANQAADPGRLHLIGPQGVSVTAGVDKTLTDGRRELLVLANQAAVPLDEELRVEHRPGRGGPTLADAYHDRDPGVTRRCREPARGGPRHFHGVLEQLGSHFEAGRPGRRLKVVPDRVRGNEPFREDQ